MAATKTKRDGSWVWVWYGISLIGLLPLVGGCPETVTTDLDHVVVAQATPTPTPTDPGNEGTGITCTDNLDQALLTAGSRLVMVDFCTDWCGWCKKLQSETFTDPAVVERAKQVICVRIDGDKRKDLTGRYNVEGYPTVFFLKSNGQEVHRVVGFRDAGQFLAELDQAFAKGGVGQPAVTDDHPNQAPETAIATGQCVAGNIEKGGDIDFFKFNAQAGNMYILETRGTSDTILTLYDKDGTTQLADNDDTNGRNARIEWTAPSNGTYHVAIKLYSSTTGPYELCLSQDQTSVGITCTEDLNSALQKARSSHKVVMIDFCTEWCGWCKKLRDETLTDPRVIEKAQQVICVRIDGDNRRDLVSQYNITGYPTIVFLSEDGREVHRVVGFRDAAGFLVEMDKALSSSTPTEASITANFRTTPIGTANCSVTTEGAQYQTVNEGNWRLLYPGTSFVEVRFNLVNAPGSGTLILRHLSSASSNARGGGYSPVNILINGQLFKDHYDVAANHNASHGFETDQWDVARYLISGQNTLRIEFQSDAQTHYWIQEFKIQVQ